MQLEFVLKQQSKGNDTLVLTYSDFGRRVRENASKGTDHGKASVHFAMGGNVKGGLYGIYPSLSDLDFKSIDNTIVQDWWGY